MTRKMDWWQLLWFALFTLSANGYVVVARYPWLWVVLIVMQAAVNSLCGMFEHGFLRRRWRACHHGARCLSLFCVSMLVSVAYHVAAYWWLGGALRPLFWSAFVCVIAHAILFWNGIICVYVTSVQLGIKWRVVGVLVGMLFPFNLICLGFILHIVYEELRLETARDRLNEARKDQQVCATKYPILFVHGVFFRDTPVLNYWGRIPAELKRNGATVFYGKHSSALSVADSGNELAWRIKMLCHHFGCEKLNIIAHSKGGLDCRYALMYEGIAPYVASLTTVNTPHRGAYFADYMLDKISPKMQKKIADTYNTAAHALGDEAPDLMAAIGDLTVEACTKTDKEWVMPAGIYCQSVGSVLEHARGGQFPLNFCYDTVKSIDGPNDGLVADASMVFGEKHTLMRPTGRRGISHGDIIDLNRKNIKGFDVREFYVDLVRDLKARGL